MKKLCFLLLVAIFSGPVWAKKFDPPKLSAAEAIEAAKTYVTKNRIDVGTHSFIAEVIYKNLYNEYAPAYWSVIWHVVPRTKGGWVEIRVYNDGDIKHYYGE